MNLLVCMIRSSAKIFHHPCLHLCCIASFSSLSLTTLQEGGQMWLTLWSACTSSWLQPLANKKKQNKDRRKRLHFLSLSAQWSHNVPWASSSDCGGAVVSPSFSTCARSRPRHYCTKKNKNNFIDRFGWNWIIFSASDVPLLCPEFPVTYGPFPMNRWLHLLLKEPLANANCALNSGARERGWDIGRT